MNNFVQNIPRMILSILILISFTIPLSEAQHPTHKEILAQEKERETRGSPQKGVSPAPARRPVSERNAEEALTGEEIARRVYNREDGNDSTAEIKMLLIGKGGTRSRDLVVYEKDFGKLTRTLVRFLSPSDIKGTAFLTIENEKGEDEQFLYLPALRRVRRVVSTQKDQRFVSTDFTYEDLERRKVEKDTHRLLRIESIEGRNCWVVESIPREEAHSQYGKIVSWIDQESYVPVRVDYYDKQERLFKQLRVKRLEKVQGIWTEMETEMHDLKEDHRTTMKVQNIKYNTGLSESLFTQRALMKD